MSDPIEQLRNLTQQGVDVTPLPPSEVRRRGDRLRRRNHVLAAVGGVAAIALIATPIALLAGGGERVQPPVDTPSTVVTPTETSRPAVVHEIPADFPLAVDAAADGGDFIRTGPSRVAEGVVFPSLCSDFRFGVIPQDRLGLNVTGPEYADDRTLMTFDRADNAVAAMQYLRSVVSNCPTDRNVVYDILPEADYDTGYDSFTFGASYTDGLGNDAWQATRVGRGLLLLHTYGEGTRDSIRADADGLTTLTGRITPAMCAFTEAGCGSSDVTGDQTLGPEGYGALRMGMTADEIEASGLGTVRPFSDVGAACQVVTITGWGDTEHPNVSGEVHGFVSRTHGLAIIFAQPGMETPEGIGVGSTVEEVRAAYGELSGSDAYSTKAVDGLSWFFLTDLDGKVTAFQLELADQDCVH